MACGDVSPIDDVRILSSLLQRVMERLDATEKLSVLPDDLIKETKRELTYVRKHYPS